MSGWLAALAARIGGRASLGIELPPGARVERDHAPPPTTTSRGATGGADGR
jgi:hypothetical protein